MQLIEELIEYCLSRGLLTSEQILQLQEAGLYEPPEDIYELRRKRKEEARLIRRNLAEALDETRLENQLSRRLGPKGTGVGKKFSGNRHSSGKKIKVQELDALLGKMRETESETWESDALKHTAEEMTRHAGKSFTDLDSAICQLNHLSEDEFRAALSEALNDTKAGRLTLNEVYKVYLNPDLAFLDEYEGPALNAWWLLICVDFSSALDGKHRWILKYENISCLFHLVHWKRRLLQVVQEVFKDDFSTFERWSSEAGRLNIFNWEQANKLDTTSLKIVTLLKQEEFAPDSLETTTWISEWMESPEIMALLLQFGSTSLFSGKRFVMEIRGVEYAFRWCPPGKFVMGSPENEQGRGDDERQHEVTLTKGFWMLETPVTQKMWESVMGNNPSAFKGANRPVERVYWEKCQDFCDRLSALSKSKIALPTEAQWEYACRAGTTTALNNEKDLTSTEGECRNLDEVAWYCQNSGDQTHEVKMKKANRWGLYDMHGNVCEWCSDWYGDYPSDSVTDPTGPSNISYQVCRGGSWYDDAKYCRSAYRGRDDPDYGNYDLGFRVALVPAGK